MVAPDEGGRPENNVYTFMLIVAFCFMIAGVVFNMLELNKHYDVTFGGLMSAEGGGAPPAKK
jgi:hypothetical protein